ncbi:MAG: calcium-binding protein, partial [Planctomycetota bacterium]
MNITLTAGNDAYYVFDGFLGGTSEAALGNVRNATIDGGAGRDQLNLDYAYPDRNFNLAVDASTGVVTLTTATGSIRFERFEVVAFNNVNFLIGGEAADALAGSPGNDPGLYGLGGDDTLDGGAGRDTLFGGAGNDTYVVDNSGDSVQESSTFNGSVDSGGIDIVRAAINFALGNFLENLELTGSAVSGTGNALANAITGNAAANSLSGAAGDDTLDGGAGADTLSGGAGNDVYRLDDPLDVVIEDGSSDPGGIDTIRSLVAHTLGERFENLELLGSAPVNGTGNALANAITGNAAANSLAGAAGEDTLIGAEGNDTLDGGSSDDRLSGGAGNDLYIVDSSGDLALEDGSSDPGGTDTVQATASYTLGDRLENLTLAGAGAISGTGNALANRITGNDADNTLEGGAGNDTLEGRGGADSLRGGAGGDTYIVNGAGDRVDEATAPGSGIDAGG